MTPIHHFYHVYADGAWEEAVTEHIGALRESGLELAPGFTFQVGMVGNQKNVNRVREYLDRSSVEWRLAACAREGWEQLTLAALAEESHHVDGLICYGHTKGAHNPSRFNTDWRRRMTFYNLIRWKDAVRSLETHDAYGCHWMELQGNWLFGGNFWWTHIHHLRLLEPPRLENRWRAEDWVGQLRNHIENFKVHDPAPPFPGSIGSN